MELSYLALFLCSIVLKLSSTGSEDLSSQNEVWHSTMIMRTGSQGGSAKVSQVQGHYVRFVVVIFVWFGLDFQG